MQIEVDLSPGDLARAMKDEAPETIVEFIRDFFDHGFSMAKTSDLVEWTINFLNSDLENGRFSTDTLLTED